MSSLTFSHYFSNEIALHCPHNVFLVLPIIKNSINLTKQTNHNLLLKTLLSSVVVLKLRQHYSRPTPRKLLGIYRYDLCSKSYAKRTQLL